MKKELLYKYFSGKTTELEEDSVVDWADQCAENRQMLFKERQVYDLLLFSELSKYGKKPPRFRLNGKLLMKYAAVVAITVGICSSVVIHKASEYKKELLSHTYVVNVPAGQYVDVELPDGTTVMINAESKLECPSVFVKGEQRRVKLSGAAYFDVVHNANDPFIVETTDYDIEVLGTEFYVESRLSEDKFTTKLISGKVRVIDQDHSANSVTLKPNQQSKSVNGMLVVSEFNVENTLLWRDGIMSFQGASFHELIRDFERHYGVEIKIEMGSMPTTRVTGKLYINEGVEQGLWALQQSVDFNYSIDREHNCIYIK